MIWEDFFSLMMNALSHHLAASYNSIKKVYQNIVQLNTIQYSYQKVLKKK